MHLNLRAMSCGGCGGAAFKLYTADAEASILVECQGCLSVSRIEPKPATLRIEWDQTRDGKESDGLLSSY